MYKTLTVSMALASLLLIETPAHAKSSYAYAEGFDRLRPKASRSIGAQRLQDHFDTKIKEEMESFQHLSQAQQASYLSNVVWKGQIAVWQKLEDEGKSQLGASSFQLTPDITPRTALSSPLTKRNTRHRKAATKKNLHPQVDVEPLTVAAQQQLKKRLIKVWGPSLEDQLAIWEKMKN